MKGADKFDFAFSWYSVYVDEATCVGLDHFDDSNVDVSSAREWLRVWGKRGWWLWLTKHKHN